MARVTIIEGTEDEIKVILRNLDFGSGRVVVREELPPAGPRPAGRTVLPPGRRRQELPGAITLNNVLDTLRSPKHRAVYRAIHEASPAPFPLQEYITGEKLPSRAAGGFVNALLRSAKLLGCDIDDLLRRDREDGGTRVVVSVPFKVREGT